MLPHAAQSAHKLQVLETRQVGIDVCLFRHIAKSCAKADHVLVDIFAFEEHTSFVRLKEAGDDLYRSRLSGAVRPKVTDDLTGTNAETDVLNRRNSPIALRKVLNLEHGASPYLYPM